jgi:DNA-binding MarR family transcriptional regulator
MLSKKALERATRIYEGHLLLWRFYTGFLSPLEAIIVVSVIIGAIDNRGISLARLASRIPISSAILRIRLRSLERRGILVVRRAPEDGRKRLVALTDTALKTLEKRLAADVPAI